MIEAFEVRSVVDLDDGKVESIHAYSDRLILGLADGNLRIYKIKDPFSAEDLGSELIITQRIGGDTGPSDHIDQITTVKDAGAIFTLTSNSTIKIFDLETYAFAEQLSNPKSAGKFTTIGGVIEDGSSTLSRVAIASSGRNRRVVLYEWRDAEFVGIKEIAIKDRVKNLCFLNHGLLVCAYSTGEVLFLNVERSGETIAVVSTDELMVYSSTTNASTATGDMSAGSIGASSGLSQYMSSWLGGSPAPALTRISEHVVAVGRSSSVFILQVDDSGDAPKHIKTISAPSSIADVGYSYPYLVLVLECGAVEFRNVETGNIIQRLDMPSTENGDKIRLLNDGKLLYVAGGKHVYRLLSREYSDQIELLSGEGKYVEAISLLSQIEAVLFNTKSKSKSKEATIRDLKISLATELFHEEKYQEAMDMFSEISASPDVVVALYPTDLNEATQPSLLPFRSFLAETRRKISSLSMLEETGGDDNDDNGSSRFIEFNGVKLSKEIYGSLEQAAELTDTTLFRTYLITSPSLVGSLVRVQNKCDPKVVQEQLEKKKMWKELADFYHNKSLHRDALELLKLLGSDTDNSDPSIAFFEGPEPTVNYLKKLDGRNIDLILEFSRWPISLNREYGVELFIDGDNIGNSTLPKNKVLDFLKSLDNKNTSCYLSLKYLESLIYQHHDKSPSIHNSLALTYIEAVKNDNGIWDRFISFIQNSDYFRPDRVLLELPRDREFLSARAILHGKRGEHKKTLEIYAFDMNDTNLASRYCSKKYQTDAKVGQECLHILLALYLEKKDGNGQYREAVVDLLASQGSRMSAVEVLNNLPSDIKISEIDSFLKSQIRTLHSSVKTGQLESALCQVHLVRTQEELLTVGQCHTVVTNLTTCKVCTKRLGHSVISIFPDDVVVHYGCARAYKERLKQVKEKYKNVTVDDRRSQQHGDNR